MKKSLIVVSTLLFKIASFAQCDIAQTAFSISPKSISVGQTAELKFNISNVGVGGCAYGKESVKIVVSIPKRPYDFQAFATSQTGSFFNWSFDANKRVIIGVNHSELPHGDLEKNITIKLVGKTEGQAISNINLELLDGSDNLSIDNDPGFASLQIVAAPLPVKLENFYGKSSIKGNTLSWKTSTESNFSHFEIEKSLDTKEFAIIGKVEGFNAKNGSNYTFTDERPQAGMLPGANLSKFFSDAFYRLKMIDLDGSTNYSNIIFIEDKIQEAFIGKFYPNPAIENSTEINIIATANEVWSIKAVGINGKVLVSETKNLIKGNNKISVKLPKEISGEILYQIENANGVVIRKLIKN